MLKNDNVMYMFFDWVVGFEIVCVLLKDIIFFVKVFVDYCLEIEVCSVGKLDVLYNVMDEVVNAEDEEV